jgi:hypothetical protein
VKVKGSYKKGQKSIDREKALRQKLVATIAELGGVLLEPLPKWLRSSEVISLSCCECGQPSNRSIGNLVSQKRTVIRCVSCQKENLKHRLAGIARQRTGTRKPMDKRLIDQIVRLGATPPAKIDRPQGGDWFFDVGVICSCGEPMIISSRRLFRAEKSANPWPIKCSKCKARPKGRALEILDRKIERQSDLKNRIAARIKALNGQMPDVWPDHVTHRPPLNLTCACGGVAKTGVRNLFRNDITGIRCRSCGSKYREKNRKAKQQQCSQSAQ